MKFELRFRVIPPYRSIGAAIKGNNDGLWPSLGSRRRLGERCCEVVEARRLRGKCDHYGLKIDMNGPRVDVEVAGKDYMCVMVRCVVGDPTLPSRKPRSL